MAKIVDIRGISNDGRPSNDQEKAMKKEVIVGRLRYSDTVEEFDTDDTDSQNLSPSNNVVDLYIGNVEFDVEEVKKLTMNKLGD